MITFRFNDQYKKLIEDETGLPYDRLVSNTIEQSMEEIEKLKSSKRNFYKHLKIPQQVSRNVYI